MQKKYRSLFEFLKSTPKTRPLKYGKKKYKMYKTFWIKKTFVLYIVSVLNIYMTIDNNIIHVHIIYYTALRAKLYLYYDILYYVKAIHISTACIGFVYNISNIANIIMHIFYIMQYVNIHVPAFRLKVNMRSKCIYTWSYIYYNIMMCVTLKYTHREITSNCSWYNSLWVYHSVPILMYIYIGVYTVCYYNIYSIYTPTFYFDSVIFHLLQQPKIIYIYIGTITIPRILSSFSFTSSIPSIFSLVLSLFLSPYIYYTL